MWGYSTYILRKKVSLSTKRVLRFFLVFFWSGGILYGPVENHMSNRWLPFEKRCLSESLFLSESLKELTLSAPPKSSTMVK